LAAHESDGAGSPWFPTLNALKRIELARVDRDGRSCWIVFVSRAPGENFSVRERPLQWHQRIGPILVLA